MANPTFPKIAPLIRTGRGLIGEFKTFMLRGNVVQLAVAVVIGAAFTKVVEAFSKGFVVPLLSIFSETKDFSYLNRWGLGFGDVLGALLQFVITAAVVFFFIVKPMNKLMSLLSKAEEETPVVPSEDILLLREIRDSLKKKP